MKARGFIEYGLMSTLLLIVVAASLTSCLARKTLNGRTSSGVSMHLRQKQVVMDNGILQVTLAVPQGYVVGISYNGIDNLLETENKKSNRGYWDLNWDAPAGRCGQGDCTDGLIGSSFKIIHESANEIELSFSSRWDPNMWNSSSEHHNPRLPINIDRRYIMLRGLSGLYSYAILDRQQGWPANTVYQIRAVYKLRSSMYVRITSHVSLITINQSYKTNYISIDIVRFHYMAVSDERQSFMPTPQDRDNGKSLAYKEAVLLTDPTNTNLKGEVDDKYQYSCEDKDNIVHGWISSDPSVGFWMITASNEFRSGGPFKQDLTSHTGPTTLAMFHSTHYAGTDVAMTFEQGEPWKKVFGPFFIYMNTAPTHQDHYHLLWEDAKRQSKEEIKKWPYEFVASQDFPKYMNNSLMSASLSWVGLAAQGEPGSWQKEAKGYQFWTKADSRGSFHIKGIREGNYSLYAYAPGFIGDYKYEMNINILPGNKMILLGNLIYKPLRNGPTLWEIGIPDRSAAEFFIPNPISTFSNKLYVHKIHERFRQYGLWARYNDLYPKHDLVYTIGSSDYHKDWFFAHVPRVENMTYTPTTWQIVFPLTNVDSSGNYTLRLALAAAVEAEVQVRFNDPSLDKPQFTTMRIGKDNAIARHGIHGLYWLFNVGVVPSWLRSGYNTMFLTQSRSQSPFQGVMYDYIRLEEPQSRRH
ncbi:hypothetical protein V2J09_014035 [Rumex salicifolius]